MNIMHFKYRLHIHNLLFIKLPLKINLGTNTNTSYLRKTQYLKVGFMILVCLDYLTLIVDYPNVHPLSDLMGLHEKDLDIWVLQARVSPQHF